jgi:L-asparaginase
VVLTAAMRPATALQADGPQNLLDAVAVAREPAACGVVAVLAGRVHGAADVAKKHSYRIDAFDSGDSGPIGVIEEGRLRLFRTWPTSEPLGLARIGRDVARWPRVEIVTSHAGASGAVVDALAAQGVQGLVVAATGNGTVHEAIEAALADAMKSGVKVLRATRCASGAVIGDGELPSAGALSPVKARVELLLDLLD